MEYLKEREKEEGEEGEGELLINRTSLFPVDTYIEPPNPSRLNAFTLQNNQIKS